MITENVCFHLQETNKLKYNRLLLKEPIAIVQNRWAKNLSKEKWMTTGDINCFPLIIYVVAGTMLCLDMVLA